MSWARFFYGVAAGFGAGWLLLKFLDGDVASAWLLIGISASLAIALIFHQRYIRVSRGRRWRRTAQ